MESQTLSRLCIVMPVAYTPPPPKLCKTIVTYIKEIKKLFKGPFPFSYTSLKMTRKVVVFIPQNCAERDLMYLGSEPVFSNDYGAHESIPRNEFRQPM
jgi:hypothetical protein